MNRKKLSILASTAAAALSLNAAPAIAQTDIFLELDGIKGEVLTKGFQDQIDVLAWSWGLSQSGSLHSGGGGGAGKANFQDVSVTKYTELSSPALYKNLVTGDQIETGKISVTANLGKGPEVITELKMRPILVTSASTGGSGDRPTENVTLNFNEFCLKQNSIQNDGTIKAGTPFCWSIATNKEIGSF